MSNVALWIGGILLVVGLLVLTGYGVYFFSTDFMTDEEVPLGVRVAVPVAAVGALALLLGVFGQRMRDRKHESLEGADY
ncbi:MAG: hypothetical protein QF368_03105 [SAR202 cluster bacterium]|jgi:peptidoglycan/LPS O-acetylase OafA/YrhL|nr:hypothetical protein [SAR202 cluster bacterium]